MTDEYAQIISRVRQDIDDYCLATFGGERRTHLGASEVGEECLRKQWYLWRWVKAKQFPARMLRLFNRGHKEEHRFIEWLTGAGFVCLEIDPETGKQFVFSEFGGHYGGSTDSILYHPILFPNEKLIGEYKTHNDKSFKDLVKRGVKLSKPKHYAQMSNYGARFGARRGIYCAVNKNDDDLHLELVDLDWNLADSMAEKARYIITSTVPPPRMAGASPTNYLCKQCELKGVCFHKEPPDKNCRSCSFAFPNDNAEWYCHRWQGNIPKDFIPQGCGEYRQVDT